jgi:hypothetical protein
MKPENTAPANNNRNPVLSVLVNDRVSNSSRDFVVQI